MTDDLLVVLAPTLAEHDARAPQSLGWLQGCCSLPNRGIRGYKSFWFIPRIIRFLGYVPFNAFPCA